MNRLTSVESLWHADGVSISTRFEQSKPVAIVEAHHNVAMLCAELITSMELARSDAYIGFLP